MFVGKKGIMSRPLNRPNCEFQQVRPHVYHSSDIIILDKNGCARVSKWITDYEKGCSNPVTTYFTPLNVEKGTPRHPLYISRYIPFTRLLSELHNQTFSFVSPTKWQDPFERVFYEKTLIINDQCYDIRCICATYDYVYNEEAAWNRNDSKEDIVRVSFSFQAFCDLLEKIAINNHCQFYISIADYSQSKDNLIKKNKPQYKTIGDYIQQMSFKRKAFAYENEMRIFAIFETPYLPSNDIVPFKLDAKDYENSISFVTLPPMKPIDIPPMRINRDSLQEGKNAPMRAILSKELSSKIILESRLYSKK